MTSPRRVSAFSGFFWSLFHVFPIQNDVFSGEQEKESSIRVRMGKKNPSLEITDCHHSASLVMPIGDPRDGFFLFHPHTHDGFLYYCFSWFII